MTKTPKEKARAARAVFDGLCTLLGDEGERMRKAVDGTAKATVETLGKAGLAALRDGDVVGAAAEAYRNRKALRSSETSSDEEEARSDDDDVDPL